MEGQTGARKRQDVTVGFKVKFDEDQMPVNGCLVISVFKAKEDLLANTHTPRSPLLQIQNYYWHHGSSVCV